MDSEGGLGGTSVEIFGPLAVMLVGYHPQEFERFRAFMIDMEADMVKVKSLHCKDRRAPQAPWSIHYTLFTSCRWSAAMPTSHTGRCSRS